MRLRFRLGTVALFAWLSLVSAESAATTLEKFSLERMTDLASVIVRARCMSNESRWDSGEIWTLTSFQMIETWKGSPPAELTVRLLGGTVGPLTSSISGVPRFHPGEAVVLFLEPTRHGDLTVVSWQQGTFRIGRDRRSGIEVVTQDTATFEIFDPQEKEFKATGIQAVPFEDFRARVEAAAVGSFRRKP